LIEQPVEFAGLIHEQSVVLSKAKFDEALN
jgi:hypothetical protein